ncbi:MAG TPA: pyridoxal phosphate-dependent aminotransferase [Puia sp.]|nr:pyridoxal phosphate-dependent aminotransferase [Puia sp.]
MRYRRMPIEAESPEQVGYDKIRNNLSESSYSDALLRDFDPGTGLRDLVLCYGSHQGHDGLREQIAKEAGLTEGSPATPGPATPGAATRDGATHATDDDAVRDEGSSRTTPSGTAGLNRDHVLLTVGAAGALFIIATTLLEKDDEVAVVRPNYATNIETPRAIGAAIRDIDLHFEEGFALDLARVTAAITPKTKYLSVTYPHNPTGVCLDASQLYELVRLAEDRNIRLLVDETYRDMVFGTPLPLAATLSPRVISVSSLSKSYGLPGLRTGWIVCRDSRLMQRFLAAKEQMHICGPVIDEELAFRYFRQKQLHFARIKMDIAAKFRILRQWIGRQEEFEWVEPRGGCVCFPRLRRPGSVDAEVFYRILLERYGTYVGPGHWFEMPKHYMRIGYGWPAVQQLEEGLEGLSKAVRDALLK